jgi:GNAT superfamily N-acetyltransferase
MLELIAYQSFYLPALRQLFTEHLQAAQKLAQAEYSVRLDVPNMLERELDREALAALYTPPQGYLLLAQLDEEIVGCAAIRQLDVEICELCRMYVQPAYRRQGIAKALLDRLIALAATANYTTIRLDTPRFAGAAHQLYADYGFVEIPPYPGTKIPLDRQPYWLYMERSISLDISDSIEP